MSRHPRRLAACGSLVQLLFLPAPQQVSHLLGIQQAGDAQVVGLLVAAGRRRRPERRSVEDHLIEFGFCAEVFDLVVLLAGLVALLRGEFGVQRVLQGLPVRLAEDVVALGFHLAGQHQQVGHRRQEDAGCLAGPPGPDEAPDRLGEEQRCRRARGIDADREPGHVDAFGHHSHRHQPPRGSLGEGGDPLGGALVVGQHHGGVLAGDLLQEFGVGPRSGLVGGDDHPAGVGHVLAQAAQPGIGRGDHRGHPFSRGVQRGPPCPRGLLSGQRFAEAGGMLLAGAIPPTGLAGVGHEHHRPHDPVGQCVGVSIAVVGLGSREAVRSRFVIDERDRAVVAAERGAGQRQPSGRVVERLPDGVTPGFGVTAMVDLVENHERLAVLGADPVPARVTGHLGVGHHDTVVLVGGLRVGVGEPRVQRNADPCRGLRPLNLEVFGRDDDRDSLDGAFAEQFGDDTQGKRRLACAGGRHRQEIPGLGRQILHQRAPLPATQCPGCLHRPHRGLPSTGATLVQPRGPQRFVRRVLGRPPEANDLALGIGEC